MIKIILLLLALILITLYSFKGQGTLQSSLSQATQQVLNQGCQPADPGSPTASAYSYQLLSGEEDEEKNPAFTNITKDAVRDISQPKIAYKQILKNVAVRLKTLSKELNKLIDQADGGLLLSSDASEVVNIRGANFRIYYPSRHGSISIQKVGGIDKIRPSRYGLIFLAHLNSNNNPIYIDGKTLGLEDNFIVADVYQNPNSQLPPGVLEALTAECQGLGKEKNQVKTAQPQPPQPPSIYYPQDQKVSQDKNQLQLEYFLFSSNRGITSLAGVWDMHCKPAIYLYPQKVTQVNVKVKTKGFLTYTDPKYSEGGWNVIAHPDGRVIVDGKDYPYLYYESKVPDQLIEKPVNGYVVEFSKLPKLYDLILPQLGLDQTQSRDFKVYWTKALPYSPYYFVGVMDQKNLDEFEPLEINPQPDLSIRVRVYFEAFAEKPTNLLTDPNSLTINHKSSIINPVFKLIEWGGMVKSNPLEPFTCSQ